jgi:hypothetical protein
MTTTTTKKKGRRRKGKERQKRNDQILSVFAKCTDKQIFELRSNPKKVKVVAG